MTDCTAVPPPESCRPLHWEAARKRHGPQVVLRQVIVPYPAKGPSTKAFQKTAARLQGVKLMPCRTVAEVRPVLVFRSIAILNAAARACCVVASCVAMGNQSWR